MKEFKVVFVKISDSDSFSVFIDVDTNTPYCKKHGAMNKVSVHDDGGGYWRCLQGQCRSGCNEKRYEVV